MSLHETIKNGKFTKNIYARTTELVFCGITLISPSLNTKLRYKIAFGKYPDLNNPKTFSEKLMWLKLNRYIHDPLVIKCADKYCVRDYVTEMGCSDILNELYDVYKDPNEIVWDELPQKFVLKWNFGAGMNIICKDKKEMDEQKCKKLLLKWRRTKPWLAYSEMQYKYAPKRLLCEKYLEDENDTIPDYKVYCFNGEPMAILVMHDRGKEIKTEFFDKEWNLLENSHKYSSPSQTTQKPSCLEKMLDYSRKLAKPFEFVRCDYYIVNNRLFFGELTFTPAGGLFASTTRIDGTEMSELLAISSEG